MPADKLVPELCVSNIERSIDFYVSALGFKVRFYRPEEKFAYLECGNVDILLEEVGASGNWISGELAHPYGRGVNLKIPTSDSLALHDSLKEKGYPIFLPLEEAWYRQADYLSGNRQFIVQDPDGYLLRMAQDLGRRSVT